VPSLRADLSNTVMVANGNHCDDRYQSASFYFLIF
jgi:hypothetical protein